MYSVGLNISKIMNLDLLQHQKMLYSLKKEHFVPSVNQRDDFTSALWSG